MQPQRQRRMQAPGHLPNTTPRRSGVAWRGAACPQHRACACACRVEPDALSRPAISPTLLPTTAVARDALPMHFAPLRRSLRASPEPHPPPAPAPASAMPPVGKQPPLLVLCARQPFVARAPDHQTVRVGDFFHVLTPPAHPSWYTVSNPITGASGLAPAHIFDVLSRSAAPRDPSNLPLSSHAPHPCPSASASATAKLPQFPPPGPGQPVPLVPGHAAVPDPWATRSPPPPSAPPTVAAPIAPVVPDTFLGCALYNFIPERPDELGVSAGARLRVYAHSTEEWLVAARLDPSAGETRPGLVPMTYCALIDPRTGQVLPHKPADLLALGAIPSVDVWKQRRAAVGFASPQPQQAQPAPIPLQKATSARSAPGAAPVVGSPWHRSASDVEHAARSSQTSLVGVGTGNATNGAASANGARAGAAHTKTISLSSLTHGHRQKSSSAKNGSVASSISPPMSNPNLRDGPGAVMRLAASPPSQPRSHWPSMSQSDILPQVPMPAPSSHVMPPYPPKSSLGDEPVETVDGPQVLDLESVPAAQDGRSSYAPSDPLGPAPDTSELAMQPLPSGLPTWAEVDAVHKEQGDYWYRVRCLWQPEPKGKTRRSPPPGPEPAPTNQPTRPLIELELYRLYEDFYDFHVAFMARFPLEAGQGPQGVGASIIPPLPRPLPEGELPSESSAEHHRRFLDQYIRALVALPRHLTRSDAVQLFFDPRPGDRAVPHGGTLVPKSEPVSSTAPGPVVPSYPPAASPWDPNDLATGLDQIQLSQHAGGRADSAMSRTESQQTGSGGSGRTNGTVSPPSSLPQMSAIVPSSTSASSSPAILRKQGWTKIKIFHSATDELVAVRVDPATITYAELLAKARERLGSQIGVLRYPESLGARETAAAAAAAAAAAEAGLAHDTGSGARMVMARIVDDDDLRDWLDHGGGKAMLFAAAQ